MQSHFFLFCFSNISHEERVETRPSDMWRQESALPQNILLLGLHLFSPYSQSTYYWTCVDTAVNRSQARVTHAHGAYHYCLPSPACLTHCLQDHMALTPNYHQKTPEDKTCPAPTPPDHGSLPRVMGPYRLMGVLEESVNPLILHANVCMNIHL